MTARLGRLEARIGSACGRAGRARDEVRLIAASKMQPAEAIAEAHAAGLRAFGENRVQEGLEKAARLPESIEWHLLGPLQSNKVRTALRLFRTFHAIDRVKIGLLLDEEARRAGLSIEGYLEVNAGGEASKHGFAPDRLAEEAAELAGLANLEIVGLMAVPPPSPTPEGSRPWFRKLAALARDLAARPEWGRFRGRLSMGMSDDFEIAIEEGATDIRLGTALFGARPAGEVRATAGVLP